MKNILNKEIRIHKAEKQKENQIQYVTDISIGGIVVCKYFNWSSSISSAKRGALKWALNTARYRNIDLVTIEA